MSACLTEVHVVVSVVSSGPTPSHTLQYRIFRKLTCEVLQCRIKDSNVFKRNECKFQSFLIIAINPRCQLFFLVSLVMASL